MMKTKKVRLHVTAVFVTALVLLKLPLAFAEEKGPNVAGKFYPKNGTQLRRQVLYFLKNASVPEDISPQNVISIISPHAGYVFSGQIAGWAYKAVEGKKVDRVVVLAPSHFFDFYGIKVLDVDSYKVPTGSLSIDKVFLHRLVDNLDIVSVDNSVFQREHSIEVQLPFLKELFSSVRYVFLLFGRVSFEDLSQTAKKFYDLLGASRATTLVVVSTDLSHYHRYSEAVEKDWRTIDVLRKLNPKQFYKEARQLRCELCGWIPVTFALLYTKLWGDVEFRVLKYANSGDTYGERSKVVGYLAAAIVKKSDKEVAMFNKEQRAKLLKLARRSIEHYLKTHQRLADLGIDDPALYKERGAFVTLKEDGMLRGCIGHIIGDMPLCEVVAEMAIQSAVGDPRFPALTLEELPKVEIEISVLSPLKKVEDINEIKIGKHGLLLRKGFYSGLLLPQVPVEYGWDRLTFLRQLAVKAGLPPDQWQGAELYSFTAEVFSESDVFGEGFGKGNGDNAVKE